MKLTWTRPLRCPKCGGEFDYEFVPGASFTAIRLWNARYMRCPLCHEFALFKMSQSDLDGPPAALPAERPPPLP